MLNQIIAPPIDQPPVQMVIHLARRSQHQHIRRVAGLESVEELAEWRTRFDAAFEAELTSGGPQGTIETRMTRSFKTEASQTIKLATPLVIGPPGGQIISSSLESPPIVPAWQTGR